MAIVQNQTEDATRPEHYRQGAMETIEEMELLFTREELMGFCKCNIHKYRSRAPYSGKTADDLAKADWYALKLRELKEDR